MRPKTISQQISLGFALLLCCMACLAGASLYTIRQVLPIENAHAESHLPAAALATSFEREILNARIFFIYHVSIQKPGALEKGWERYRNAEEREKELVALVNKRENMAGLRPAVAQLQTDLDAYEPALQQTLQMVARDETKGDAYNAQVKDWAAKGAVLVGDAGKLETLCFGLSATSSQSITAALESAESRQILIFVGSLLLCLFVAALVVRQINQQLRSISQELRCDAEQLGSAAGELTASSRSLAEGASRQAASLEETSAAATEISASAASNSNAARNATKIMSSVESHIHDGNQKLSGLSASMREMNRSSKNISEIIKIINDIAFQTNLLALNAAVEAARAGEAGLGFSVVADEVRNLAQRSSQAAKDTGGLIEEAIRKTNEGSEKLGEVHSSMRLITEEAGKVTRLVDQVSQASQEQAHGVEQISRSISEMERITQMSVASSEQSAATSHKVNSESETIRDLVERLTLLIEGGSLVHQRGSRSPIYMPTLQPGEQLAG